MRKILIIIFVLTVLTLSVTLSACDYQGDIYLQSVNITAYLKENGDLEVIETWTAKINEGEYRNLYKEINLYDRDFNAYSKIKDVSVRDEDNGIDFEEAELRNLENGIPPGVKNVWYLDKRSASVTEFGLVMPVVDSGTRTFTFSYTVTGMARRYNDGTRIDWKPFSEDFTLYIEDYKATLYLPDNASTEGSLAWFHNETAGSYVEIKEDCFYYSAQNVSAGTQIETRVLTPNERFSGLGKVRNADIKEATIAEEEKWLADWLKELDRRRILSIVDIILAVLVAVEAVIVTLIFRNKNKRIKDNYPEYYREIPEGWSAAELGHLFYYYQGGVARGDRKGRLLSATMLELARRYYIEIIPGEGDDYKINVQNSPEGKLNELLPHERALLDLLRDVEDHFGREFTMDDFEKYAKKEYRKVDTSIRAFHTRSEEKFKRAGFIDNIKKAINVLTVVAICHLGIGAIAFASGLSEFPVFGVAGLLGGVFMLLLNPKLPRLNKAGEAEFMKAEGLKKYMLDFSNLKEYDVPKLVLWEEYLVFATMMGISREVIKSLKLVYPELREENLSVYRPNYAARSFIWTYVWLSKPSFGPTGGLDLGARFDKALNNVAVTARALANPKSGGYFGGFGGSGKGLGGGGFRGGGGGFGGGGGGAR